MKTIKESKPCPSCSMSIPRKNFKAVITKCLKCGIMVCNDCKINETCINCFVGDNTSSELLVYNQDKYAQGVAT